MIVRGQPTQEQRIARLESTVEALVGEVRQLRAQLGGAGASRQPCECDLAKYQRRANLPIDCGHERSPGQGPTVMERRQRELAEIDAEQDGAAAERARQDGVAG
jgi:hypothetical protein